MTFVDRGGEHVHLLRDEGAVEARTVAVQIIPAGRDAADQRARLAGMFVLSP